MTDSFPDIRYLKGSEWLPLPGWSISLVRLGQEIATKSTTHTRLLVAVALPTRRYSGVFVGVGIVMSSEAQSRPKELYESYIQSQQPGTSVIFTSGRKRLRGRIEEFSEIGGQKYISIRVGNRDVRRGPLSSLASRIQVVGADFNFTDYQNGRQLAAPAGIVRGAFRDPLGFVSHSQLDVVFVTMASEMEAEVSSLQIGISSSDAILEGSPMDILRISRFLGGEPYRSDLYTVSTAPEEDLNPKLSNPSVVAFSDATGYLKHHAKWPTAHQIVLLDRTHRSFTDAVTSINQRYYRRFDGHKLAGVEMPSNIESIAFEELT